MAFQMKDGTGSLFVNDRKETQQHPDYNGSVMVGGIEYWISGWKKSTGQGKPYLSLSVRPKQSRNSSVKAAPKTAPEPFDDDNLADVPF